MIASKTSISSKGGIKAILAYYQTLGQNFVDALEDMLVFDAIICNTDRHYGNFGVLVNSSHLEQSVFFRSFVRV